jgi:hypothetical protein
MLYFQQMHTIYYIEYLQFSSTFFGLRDHNQSSFAKTPVYYHMSYIYGMWLYLVLKQYVCFRIKMLKYQPCLRCLSVVVCWKHSINNLL